MSIKDEILRIKTNISNAYTELSNKGVSLPSVQNSENLASTIANMVVGGGASNEIIDGTITEVNEQTLGGVESIRNNAFSGLQIETVNVPSNVSSIGDSAFADNNITTLTINEGVETIGNNAFQNNSITEVTIPASVTSIGDSAFAGNVLTEITMESNVPPIVTATTFPSTLQTTNVPYNGYTNYAADENWQTYKDTLVRGLAIPSTITVTVNNYLGELINGASVTIAGNGQTYTGTTNANGVFSQGDLQPATYTISVADLEGFKTPENQEVVVEEDTQNSVTVTYLEKPQGIEFDRVFGNNSPAAISAVSAEISANNMTSSQVAETYGWNIGDTISFTLTTGENVEMRIIGFNHDDKSDGTGKAGITLDMTHSLKNSSYMNSTNTNAGGYGSSYVNNKLLPSISSQIPTAWSSVIKNVNKSYAGSGSTIGVVSDKPLFLLSAIEIGLENYDNWAASARKEGTQYEYYSFGTRSDKIKPMNGSAGVWWIRSRYTNSTGFTIVLTDGGASWHGANNKYGISFAFCV